MKHIITMKIKYTAASITIPINFPSNNPVCMNG